VIELCAGSVVGGRYRKPTTHADPGVLAAIDKLR